MVEHSRTGSTVVGFDDEGRRLDVFTADLLEISRNHAQRLISEGRVKVNGIICKKNHIVSISEAVTWEIPPAPAEEIVPQDLPLKIYHDDEDIIVLSKPAHMVVYPGPGHPKSTLANALVSLHPEIAGVGGRGRPGIVHRLDRGTSGLMVIAKNDSSYQALIRQMKQRDIRREYQALVCGVLGDNSGTINAAMGRSLRHRKRMAVLPFGGRRAVTHFEVLERFHGYTLTKVSLETGRTHQIRVHMSYIGHPVAGDPEYGRHKGKRLPGLDRQFLHAHDLVLRHPGTGESMEFEDPLPDDLERALKYLSGENEKGNSSPWHL